MPRWPKFRCPGCRRQPKLEDAWRWGVRYVTEDGRTLWAWSTLVCGSCAEDAAEIYRLYGHEVDTAGPGELPGMHLADDAAQRLAGPEVALP